MELKLDWSKETVHTDGRFVSTASPTQEFWTVWREKKAAIKAAGYSVRKVTLISQCQLVCLTFLTRKLESLTLSSALQL